MRLFRRTRRKPDLVIPTPVIGPTTIPQHIAAAQVGAVESLDDHFLWGDATPGSPKQMMLSLPRDIRAINAMYQGQRPPREGEWRPNVTYDPVEAAKGLLEACRMPQPTKPEAKCESWVRPRKRET